jgi:hypothetical protein
LAFVRSSLPLSARGPPLGRSGPLAWHLSRSVGPSVTRQCTAKPLQKRTLNGAVQRSQRGSRPKVDLPLFSLIGLAESQACILESYRNQCSGTYIGSEPLNIPLRVMFFDSLLGMCMFSFCGYGARSVQDVHFESNQLTAIRLHKAL